VVAHGQETAAALRTRPTGRARSVAIVTSGNFLEMFDFMMFGYYAPGIAATYFPSSNQYLSLILALTTFGAGFIMRPVGAVLLGAYMDRHGRRAGLLLTMGLMAVGTLVIALLPGYASIGLLAPLLVLGSRFIQGLSAGAEVGGVSTYLAEIADAHNKGFYVSWQSASQQVAVVCAALIGAVVAAKLSPADMRSWGWRVPFVAGCLLIPFLLLARSRLSESPAFQHRARPPTRAILRSIALHWRPVLFGSMLAVLTTVAFYLITAYTPTFGTHVLQLSTQASLAVSVCVGTLNFILLPIMGSLSDRIGRRRQLIVSAIAALVTGYPLLAWLAVSPSFVHLLAVQLWIATVYAAYNGAMVVYLTEIMPAQVRAAGFSLAYSVATALFGGFTPAICTFLIHVTGNRAMPGAWLSMAAAIGLAGVFLTGRADSAAEPTH
jgi:MFS family permease